MKQNCSGDVESVVVGGYTGDDPRMPTTRNTTPTIMVASWTG